MKYKHWFFVMMTLLTFLLPAFAQEPETQNYTVKPIYFLPKDREPQADIDAKMDKMIKRVQKFYADEMERHGFGRKTFQFETDENGNAVVHHVIGKHNNEHYLDKTGRSWREIHKQVKRSKSVLFNAIDVSNKRIKKGICGLGGGGQNSGQFILPASGGCFNFVTIAHELGHAFGLPHDWRNGAFIMSYGPGPQNKISLAAAQWLDIHPFFNTDRPDAMKTISKTRPKIKRLPVIAYPQGLFHVFFEVTDTDGLHHAQFKSMTPGRSGLSMQKSQTLNGENEIVEYISTGKGTRLSILDIHGNITSKWISFKNLKPNLTISVTPSTVDAQEGLIGHWNFDEANGGIAYNNCGKDTYAVLEDGANLQLNSGKIGGALELDGTQRVNIPNGGNLINGLKAFTIAFWVKPEQIGNDKGFINPKNPNNKDEVFTIRYDAKGYKGGGKNVVKASISTTQGTQAYESASDAQTTAWQHITLTWKSGQELSLYLNGILDKPTFNSPAAEGEIIGVEKLVIGRGSKDRRNAMRGYIDDVRLYNRVLNIKEIADLSLTTTNTNKVYGVALTAVANLTPKIVDPTEDVNYTLTITNTGDLEDTIKLTTNSSTHAKLSESSVSLGAGRSAEVTMTVTRDSLITAGEHDIEITATSAGDNTKTANLKTKTTITPIHGVELTAVGKLTAETNNADKGTEYTLLVTNTGNTEDTIKITTVGDANTKLSQDSVLLEPGASSRVKLMVTGTGHAQGADYIVRVTATSERDSTKSSHIATLTTIYQGRNKRKNIQDDLIAHWTFDETTGKTVPDTSGKGNKASLTGNAVLQPNSGKIKGALQPNGTDAANVTHGAELINGLEAFTIALWIKSNKTGTDEGFIYSKEPNDKDETFAIRYDSEGAAGGGNNVIKAAVTTTEGIQIYESASNVQTTEWQHIALTWRTGRQLILYINGVLDTSTFSSKAKFGKIIGAEKLLIGKGAKDLNGSFSGLIDDVRLYDRILNGNEIAKLLKVSADASNN